MAQGRKIGEIRFGVLMDTGPLAKSATKGRGILRAFTVQATKMLGVFAGAAGVTGVIMKAGRSFEELNKSMNRSLAIMGNVTKAMRDDMRKAAIELSKVTNFTSSQVAEGYFFLASAGLNAEQALAAIPKVAEFAQAGNFDLALATDLLTDAQSALGLTVKDTEENMRNMARVSDVLVKANTLSNASVQQFSEALTNGAGASLKSVGKDIEEGVAVLAAFADQGVKSAEAGTAFSIVMRDLQTNAIRFPDAWKKVGVSVFDSSDEMRNLGNIVQDLEKRMGSLSDKAKKTFLLDLGIPDKSVKYIQMLIGAGDKITKTYEAGLRAATGATKEVSDKMLTPLEKAINKLKGAFQQAAEAMAPLLAKAAELLSVTADIVDKANSPGTNFDNTMKALGFRRTSPGLSRGGKAVNAMEEFIRGMDFTDNIFARDTGPRGFDSAGLSRFDRYKQPHGGMSTPFAAVPNGTGSGSLEANGAAFGRAFTSEVMNGLHSVGNLLKDTANSANANLGRLHFKLATGQFFQPNLEKKKMFSRGTSFDAAESGSVAAYQQRVRGREQFTKVAMDQLSVLKQIANNTANSAQLQLAEANI